MNDQEIFDIHSQKTGKISIEPTVKIDSKEILAKVYTPGVGKICMAIKDEPELVKKYTMAGKMVAVISDGTAVLGFGDIGPKAALPVMEGKCAIFKEFAGVDAFPLCLDETDTPDLIATIRRLAPNFAAINLEDISAPRCFEIEERLQELLDIPVMHDDQHGTAIVTLAALKGALKLTQKKNVNIVIVGAGAAGTAIMKLLVASKEYQGLEINSIKMVDSKGVVASDREDLNRYKIEIANLTKQLKTQSFEESLRGSDVFIGVSAPNLLNEELIKTMNPDPIIFAMANPTPEIMPDIAKKAGASIVATGRSDFDNQINNALVYPGVFKGLIEGNIKKATIEIKLAAADAVYEYHKENLSTTNLLPSILDKQVPVIIAETIKKLKM
jgi:malate dehydrogenase (oxaloacetate-decarboxylating)